MRRKRSELASVISILLVLILCLCSCTGPASSDQTTDPAQSTPGFGISGEDTTTGTSDEMTTEAPETEGSTEGESISSDDPFIQTDDTVYAIASLNVRSEPSTESEIVGGLAVGEEVHRTGIGEEWMRIEYNGKTAYVYGEYVKETNPAGAETTAPAIAVEGTGILYDNGGYLVAIDPGHQGKGNSDLEPVGPGASEMKAKVSSGTQGVSTGIPEHELNLAVSLYLRDELLARGYSVLMIRETKDVDISNAERAQLANDSGADAFVRVHANSLSDSSAHGALTMCMTKNNPYNGNLYSPSRTLSELVLNGLCAATGAAKKEIIEIDTMSGINWCEIPVTIVEMGFMSNPEEDEAMAQESYRQAIAKGIADGLDSYFGRP